MPLFNPSVPRIKVAIHEWSLAEDESANPLHQTPSGFPRGTACVWLKRHHDAAATPQPVIAWRHAPDDVRISFDRAIPDG